MLNNANLFEIQSGSNKLGTPRYIVSVLCIAVVCALLIVKMGMTISIIFILLPFVAVYLNMLFNYPIIGYYSAVTLGFFLLGIGRYLNTDLPLGLAMDMILILTYIALIFNNFFGEINWKAAYKDATLLALVWFGFSILEMVNPESHSFAAWFNGMRGISLYMLLMIPLALIFINTNRKLDTFLYLWGILSILASLKGIMQNTIGVDSYEKAWLDAGAAETHILFGKLRVFSFLSDAGQFGANQGYSGVVAIIIAMAVKEFRAKLFFTIVGILGLYGMLLSGTRGAISVPLAGFAVYFFIKRNTGVMISGLIILLVVFVFFKYTMIGQGNQQIRRMRSAFDPNDPSLQVRIENQKTLAVYLSTRPLGGGIGHAGVKAKKYLPNAFLSQIATDSWYVMIWAEQGIIGLMLHLFIIFYTLIKGCYHIMFRIRDPILKMKMAALAAGMFGIMVASYGNAVLGTMPTGMLIYTTIAVLLNTEILDNEALSRTAELQILQES